MNEKKICIIYIITKLELGGAQKVCLSLFKQLPEELFSTHLISGADGILVAEVSESDHVILLNNFKREISFSAIIGEIRNFKQLVQQLKKLKKNNAQVIVHTHSTKAGIIGRWAAWCAGISTRVHTIHGYAFHAHQSWFMWLTIYCVELLTSFITTHFVCVSSTDYEQGKKLFPRFSQKATIIRAAVEDTFFVPAIIKKNNNHFVFGTVSCFKPQKNLADLVHAFAQVVQNNYHARLEIIGDGVQRNYLENLIAQYQLANVITLHGWQKNVSQFMQHWHAFLLTSLWEGLPCAVIEARLQKLPVMSYRTGGIGDVIFHEQNGLLYTSKDWQSLAVGMHKLINDNGLYQKLSQHNDDFTEFTQAAMVQKHRSLYQSCLK